VGKGGPEISIDPRRKIRRAHQQRLACACSMIFLVPHSNVTVTEELIEQAEENEAA
jgi:cytosine/adenosine deaminase-related metal-dependent hydrolase